MDLSITHIDIIVRRLPVEARCPGCGSHMAEIETYHCPSRLVAYCRGEDRVGHIAPGCGADWPIEDAGLLLLFASHEARQAFAAIGCVEAAHQREVARAIVEQAAAEAALPADEVLGQAPPQEAA